MKTVPISLMALLPLIGVALIATGADRATAQARGDFTRCLSIADINERIECFEGRQSAPIVTMPSAGNVHLGPSFDCRAASTAIEMTICGDLTLSEWDYRMGRLVQRGMALQSQRQSLLESQRKWIANRNNICGAAGSAMRNCLLEQTRTRVEALTTLAFATEDSKAPADRPSPRVAQTQQQTPKPMQSTRMAVEAPPQPAPTTQAPVAANSYGLVLFLVAIAGAIGLLLLVKYQRQQNRIKYLVDRFGIDIANMILERRVWQGMTQEQLIESWDHPADVAREVYKTKIKEIWKYNQTGKNRFKDRVFLENGVVVGWKDQ